MAKQAKASQGGDHFTRWLVIGMVALVVVTGVVFSIMSSKTKSEASFVALKDYKLGAQLNGAIDVAQGSGLVFNAGAPLKIDIWEDPQCPYCRLFEEANGDYIEDLIRTKKATVVYHVLAMIGDDSVRASNAAMCAADEGQFLDFHKALYIVQPALENSGFFNGPNLIKIGSYLGLDSKSFTDCVSKGSKVEVVQAQTNAMEKYNVRGTPTVFINDKLWVRKSATFDVNEFRLAVEAG